QGAALLPQLQHMAEPTPKRGRPFQPNPKRTRSRNGGQPWMGAISARHFLVSVKRQTTLGCPAADRAVVASPERCGWPGSRRPIAAFREFASHSSLSGYLLFAARRIARASWNASTTMTMAVANADRLSPSAGAGTVIADVLVAHISHLLDGV